MCGFLEAGREFTGATQQRWRGGQAGSVVAKEILGTNILVWTVDESNGDNNKIKSRFLPLPSYHHSHHNYYHLPLQENKYY